MRRRQEGRVIYLSSFSKTLAPGFRVAWIDAPAPLAAKLEMAKQAEDLLTGSLESARSSTKPAAAASCSGNCRSCAGITSRNAT